MTKPKVAIIGTAGRDKTKMMTAGLWNWMIAQSKDIIKPDAHLVSGGAAWADHIAVHLFLAGYASELTLHLPAPINDRCWFEGPRNSAASAANYYHGMFSAALGKHTIGEIVMASRMPNCHGTVEPIAPGYGGLFARNSKVAMSDQLLAFTFGEGDVPADGGTKDTWDKCQGQKLHVSIPDLPF